MIYFGLALLVFVLIIVGNVTVFHLVIKQAIKKFIDPALSSKNMVFISYKWAGFFSPGDFAKGEKALNALFSAGLNRVPIYSYIYYRHLKVGMVKSVTIKIYRIGGSIEDVVYSSDMK
jgi:hypothetical protein